MGPTNTDHEFKTNYISVKIHDVFGRDNREFEMLPETTFRDFEQEIIDKYRIEYPILQFEDTNGEKITIDSNYSFEHAIKLAVDRCTSQRLDQCVLDIFLSERPGYIFVCQDCKTEFERDTKFGNNDYWDRCEEDRRRFNYRRSTTPVIGRRNTGYNTPLARARFNTSNYTRASTHKTFTPMRTRY